MKNQYFGDVNDYRKYGLLRVLQRSTGLRLGVCWMLTPDDGRTDGKFTSYLADAIRWRAYDPELFDGLAATLPLGRHVGHIQRGAIVTSLAFVDAIIPDAAAGRDGYFADA